MLTAVHTRDIYTRASAGFAARVHAVGDRWPDPTPLPGWDVRRLVHHLVEEEVWAPPLFAGAAIAQVGGRFDGDLLGADPVAALDAAAAAAAAAVCAEGALDRTVHLSFGDHPGHEFAMQLAADHLVHSWDLARAVGADEALDAEVVDAIAGWFREREQVYRELGVIGARAEAGADADPQTRLLAAFGRTP